MGYFLPHNTQFSFHNHGLELTISPNWAPAIGQDTEDKALGIQRAL